MDAPTPFHMNLVDFCERLNQIIELREKILLESPFVSSLIILCERCTAKSESPNETVLADHAQLFQVLESYYDDPKKNKEMTEVLNTFLEAFVLENVAPLGKSISSLLSRRLTEAQRLIFAFLETLRWKKNKAIIKQRKRLRPEEPESDLTSQTLADVLSLNMMDVFLNALKKSLNRRHAQLHE